MFRFVCTKHLTDLENERLGDNNLVEVVSLEEPSTYKENDPSWRWYGWDLSYWYCPKNTITQWSMGEVGTNDDKEEDHDCAFWYGVSDELGCIISGGEIHDNWKAPDAPGWETYHD